MPLLRALIVGDRSCLRLYMRAILRFCEIDAISVRDGSRALQCASPYGIDLILLDAEIEGSDVHEFLAAIAGGSFGKRPPPVIVCSGRTADSRYAQRLRNDGAIALLSKPFRPRDLVEAVRSAFERPEVLEQADA